VRWFSALWQRPRHRPDEPLDVLRQRGFIAIDLETTGLDPRRDRIVALAAVKFVGDAVVPALVTLVNPGQRIPASATTIHGIDDAMVADAPDEATVVQRLDEVCAGEVIVGHSVSFDVTVLARARRQSIVTPPRATLCTQRLAASLHPTWTDLTLEAVSASLGVPVAGRHTAEGDAVIAGRLLIALLPRLRARGIRTLADSLWLQETGAMGR
jgi:DNA polymerase III epsilon subunit family exonuclease